jgi:hypothetical protein
MPFPGESFAPAILRWFYGAALDSTPSMKHPLTVEKLKLNFFRETFL